MEGKEKMSLRVWLPLTKDLRNQGLDDVTVTNHGATFNSAGKLGGCYSFNGSSYITVQDVVLQNIWSYSCWLYSETSSRGWEVVMACNINGGDADMQLGLYTRPGGNVIQNTANGQYNAGIPMTYGQWNHFVGTFDGANLKTYLNGVLVNTKAITNDKLDRPKLTIGARCRGSSYDCYFQGLLNDIRIYDHCLSPMEVKQLSQGLILHYPLNGGGLLGSQYDSTIYVEPDGSLWTHIFHHNNPASARFNSTDSFATGVYLDVNRWYDVEQLCNLTTKWEFMLKEKLTSTSTENKYRWIQTVNPNTATWNDVNPDSTNITRITTSGYSTNTRSGGMWRYNNNTRMVLANSSSSNWYGAIGAWTNYSNAIPGRYDGTDVKCSTGYEDLYLRIDNCPIGIKSTIEYDCSGYCNNGTRTGTFNWTSDTPKYQVSTVFTNNRIMNESTFLLSQQNHVALAAWVKLTSYTSDRSMIALINQFYLTVDSSGRLSGYAYGKNPEGYHNSNSIIPLNQWTHVAIVWDDSTIKFYINGQLDKSITSTGTSTSNTNYHIRIGQEGGNRQVKGNLSDVRVYATALSASDVKSLYQNSAYIDSSGNVYGAVHSEV